MRVLWFMEHFLAMEAEAKYLLTARDRSYERSLKEELLRILDDAEILFGPRISSYEVQEPLFTECFTAHVMIHPFWFARIYLPNDCKTDRFIASYTLAHEAIHVLGPALDVAPTVLEEGLATYFSFEYMNRVYRRVWKSTSDPHYDAALHAVSRLLAKNQFVIKELRARQPVISKIDERLLVEVAGIDRSLAKFLCTDFQNFAQGSSHWSERAAQGAELFVDGFRSIWNQWRSV
jgi:hypothetical protein